CGQSPMTPLVGVAVEDEELPEGLIVTEAYPNPFVEKTRLRVESVPTDQRLNIKLYDVLGREVRTLFEGRAAVGRQIEIEIGGADLTPGVYLVRITGERFSAIRLAMRVRGF
ncbi:MAG: T9SS type A sorting domain-containing protein, partial [Rhodothermia bacterium]